MRKMIRQFAAEYAHKIQTAENQNAITQTEPDGPLDLTLSRSTQCAQGDWRAHINVDAFFCTVWIARLFIFMCHLYWMCDYARVTRLSFRTSFLNSVCCSRTLARVLIMMFSCLSRWRSRPLKEKHHVSEHARAAKTIRVSQKMLTDVQLFGCASVS